jgi:hypothetical protein
MFEDAKHLRRQALLCLQVAAQMSSSLDAEQMRHRAMDYSQRADKLEEGLPDDTLKR